MFEEQEKWCEQSGTGDVSGMLGSCEEMNLAPQGEPCLWVEVKAGGIGS